MIDLALSDVAYDNMFSQIVRELQKQERRHQSNVGDIIEQWKAGIEIIRERWHLPENSLDSLTEELIKDYQKDINERQQFMQSYGYGKEPKKKDVQPLLDFLHRYRKLIFWGTAIATYKILGLFVPTLDILAKDYLENVEMDMYFTGLKAISSLGAGFFLPRMIKRSIRKRVGKYFANLNDKMEKTVGYQNQIKFYEDLNKTGEQFREEIKSKGLTIQKVDYQTRFMHLKEMIKTYLL